jgi:hypothetical protein
MQTLDVYITIFFYTRKFVVEKTNFFSTEDLLRIKPSISSIFFV